MKQLKGLLKKIAEIVKSFIRFIRNSLEERRFNKMVKVAREFGLSPVKIVKRAGTEYIIAPDGKYLRIGRGK